MTVSIQPVIITADLDRLVRFCTELLGAVETRRVPEQGEPAFYLSAELPVRRRGDRAAH